MQITYERVAGIDVGKKIIAVAVRTPEAQPGARHQQIRQFATFYRTLGGDDGLADRRGRHTREYGVHRRLLATGVPTR